MKVVLNCLAALLTFLLPIGHLSSASASQDFFGLVVGVLGGDTIEVLHNMAKPNAYVWTGLIAPKEVNLLARMLSSSP